MEQSGADYNKDWIPGDRDVSENFVDAEEYFGPEFKPPCTPEQALILRRNRNLFTSGEDNLVLRGVNLYGEKQWNLIADRFLPDRNLNSISQRYAKLCYMLYLKNGIKIDKDGNLEEPPKFESVDDFEEEKAGKLKKVEPPAILNVHRWSLEEDLTLLKAVPVMGSMWAELRARLIPHRDRGHLRKRYQVLERRIKATVNRINKYEKNLTKWIPKKAVPPVQQVLPAPVPAVGPFYQPVVGSGGVAGWQPGHYAYPPQHPSPAQTGQPYRAAPAHASTKASPQRSPLRMPAPHYPYPTQQSSPAQSGSTYEAAAILANAKTAPPGSPPRMPRASPPRPQTAYPAQEPRPAQEPQMSQGVPAQMPHPSYFYQPHPSYLYQPPRTYAEMHYTDGSQSRAAYEKLVESNQEWSQMSHIQRMMQNEETMVADTIVTQLAKSPAKSVTDSPASSTGETSGKGSLLAGVLERAEQNGSDGKKKTGRGKRALEDSSEKTIAATASVAGSIETPSKKRRSLPMSSTPSTYSAPSTPGGYIPRFSPGSTLNKTYNGSPYAYGYGYEYGDSITGFSQAAHSMDGTDLNRVFESTSEAVRRDLDKKIGTGAGMSLSKPIFGDGTTLMENDLEAISALNQLSHSPAKLFVKGGSESDSKRTSRKCRSESKGAKKSLFDVVVGNDTKKKKGKGSARKKK
jgi:hypothetical protein